MLQIKKRTGEIVQFDRDKIITAINKAFLEVDGKLYKTSTAEDIARDIEKRLKKNDVVASIEQLQDWVEEYLMRSERQDVARAYVRFRYKKELFR
jgi:ribonucleoside-triphosphate reductase